MAAIPAVVRSAFNEVKAKEHGYITLKTIKNGYYVYRQSGKWDPQRKRTKPIAEYLGKITKEGIFVRKALSAKDDLTNAKALIAAHGGEIIWHEKPEEIEGIKETVVKELTPDEIDTKLLTILSMNARADLAYWGRKLGLSEQATYYRVKKLEEKLGIKYITEINVEKLGYLKFIGFAKFLGDIPNENEIRSVLEKDPSVQLVLLTSGKYDIVFFFYAQQNGDVASFIHRIRVLEPAFRKYKARWFVAPYFESFGFLPLKDEFLDIIKEQVSKRKEGTIYTKLSNRDIAVLRSLNKQADKSFTKIDEDENLGKGASDYSYYKLKKEGFIVRTTINLTSLPIKFNAILIFEIIDGIKFDKARIELLQEIIKSYKFVSKYSLVGDIEVPHAGILFFPVFDEDELQRLEAHISTRLKGVRIRLLVIKKIMSGSFCYRKFDESYAPQHDRLVKEYKVLEPVKQVDYDYIGRKG
ncbi:MAG TPA: AsnC family transcriptional regulator [Candidatus Acidoferrum sp.]|nr:AsnC family transcriptional regulator [Candidatus Acidoferrum sp.]